jgi:hypothetical protein
VEEEEEEEGRRRKASCLWDYLRPGECLCLFFFLSGFDVASTTTPGSDVQLSVLSLM